MKEGGVREDAHTKEPSSSMSVSLSRTRGSLPLTTLVRKDLRKLLKSSECTSSSSVEMASQILCGQIRKHFNVFRKQ